MCHGHVDPKFMLRETEDQVRAAQAAQAALTDKSGAAGADTEIPPQFIPGWRGVWARIRHLIPRRRAAVVPAE